MIERPAVTASVVAVVGLLCALSLAAQTPITKSPVLSTGSMYIGAETAVPPTTSPSLMVKLSERLQQHKQYLHDKHDVRRATQVT